MSMPLLRLVQFPPDVGEPAGNRVEASRFRQRVPVTVLWPSSPVRSVACPAGTSGYARAAEDADTKKLASLTAGSVQVSHWIRLRIVIGRHPWYSYSHALRNMLDGFTALPGGALMSVRHPGCFHVRGGRRTRSRGVSAVCS